MNISEFAIKKSVTATMTIIVLAVLGFMSLLELPSELLPNFSIPIVGVNTTWTGASPEDIDDFITSEIEDAVISVEGVKDIRSISIAGVSTVVLEFDYGSDTDEKVTLVQSEVNKVLNDLPNDADNPIVGKFDLSAEATMNLEIVGSSLKVMNAYANDILKERIEQIEGVGSVDIFGGEETEVVVEVDPSKAEIYNLHVQDIYNIIYNSNLNLPAGTITDGGKDYLVRIFGKVETLDEIKNIFISNNNGRSLYLKDIANVYEDKKDVESYFRTYTYSKEDTNEGINQAEPIEVPSINLAVNKTSDGNTVEISKEVNLLLKDSSIRAKDSRIEIKVAYDAAKFVNNSIGTVSSNALSGLILASIILLIFLKDIRATAIAALGIPTSIIIVFLFLSLKDISLNIISLMGLALGVGMMVDNSVVVLDSIYRHLSELKKPKMEASRDGAQEIMVAVIASTATSMVVFIPVVLREGLSKEIFHDLSFAIVFALGASLIVALILVPVLASKLLVVKEKKEGKLFTKFKEMYSDLLKLALKARFIVVIIVLTAFVITMMAAGKYLKSGFMPIMDESIVSITGLLPKGTTIDRANEISFQMSEILKQEKYKKSFIKFSNNIDTDRIFILIDTEPKANRDQSVFELAEDLRNDLEGISDVTISVSTSTDPAAEGGGETAVVIKSLDEDDLKKQNDILLAVLEEMDGLVDISTSLAPGIPEAKITIDRNQASRYGITIADITNQVSQQLVGIAPMTLTEGTEEIDVTVKVPEEYREDIGKLLETSVILPNKSTILLKEMATLTIEEGLSTISKENKIPVANIGINTTENVALSEAEALISNKIEELQEENILPSNFSYEFGGDSEQSKEMRGELSFAFAISIFLIYFILSSQFESFIEPFLVLGTVPLALIGVIFGVLITGIVFDIMVMIGVIMLAGIVVNNAIVLIDYIKILMERGSPKDDAIVEAGKTRLRPILMTTLTTVFGMIPLAVSDGEGTEFYKGMAIAVIFGLMLATVLTLIYIPVLFSLLESIKASIKKNILKDNE